MKQVLIVLCVFGWAVAAIFCFTLFHEDNYWRALYDACYEQITVRM